jgi:hypothetical protein
MLARTGHVHHPILTHGWRMDRSRSCSPPPASPPITQTIGGPTAASSPQVAGSSRVPQPSRLLNPSAPPFSPHFLPLVGEREEISDWFVFSPSSEDRSPAPSRGSSVASYAEVVQAKGKFPLVESNPCNHPSGRDVTSPSSWPPLRSTALSSFMVDARCSQQLPRPCAKEPGGW